MKFCFVLRGLPGTGKDEIAKYLAQLPYAAESNPPAITLSTDQFFIKDGKYQFDKTKLKEAHEATWEAFKSAISSDSQVIIINNTNIKKFHYAHYVDYAQRHGYLTSVVIIPANDVSDRELATRNVHNVDQGTISKMRKEFEWSF